MPIRAISATGPNIVAGLSTPSLHGKAAAGATNGQWVKGGIAIITTGGVGQVGWLTDGPADPTGIAGIFEQDGPQAADSQTVVRFIPCLAGVAFEGTLGGAAGVTIVSTDSMLWQEYGLTESANLWRIDTSKQGATGRVRIIGFRDPIGTADARAFFTFTQDNTIYGAT